MRTRSDVAWRLPSAQVLAHPVRGVLYPPYGAPCSCCAHQQAASPDGTRQSDSRCYCGCLSLELHARWHARWLIHQGEPARAPVQFWRRRQQLAAGALHVLHSHTLLRWRVPHVQETVQKGYAIEGPGGLQARASGKEAETPGLAAGGGRVSFESDQNRVMTLTGRQKRRERFFSQCTRVKARSACS